MCKKRSFSVSLQASSRAPWNPRLASLFSALLRRTGSLLFALIVLLMTAPFAITAHGETATFVSPSTLDPVDLAALSTAGDSSGLTVTTSQSLQLLFDQPFAATTGDSVSIFTLPAGSSANSLARGTIRFGVYENGVATFVAQRNFRSGQQINVNNLFQRGCGAAGGCNFIEILTRRTRGDAEGVRVDYVQLNGEVVSVTAPTPEPATWFLMILGFVAIAARCKNLRRNSHRPHIALGSLTPALTPSSG